MTDLVLYITKEQSFEQKDEMNEQDFMFYIHSDISTTKVPILSSGMKSYTLVLPPNSSGVMYAEVIGGYVEKILHSKSLKGGYINFKVFYGTDYKTYGVTQKDTWNLPRNMRHEIPMEPREIQYFMKLFFWTSLSA